MLIRDITIIEQGAAMIHVRIGLATASAGPRPAARLAGNPLVQCASVPSSASARVLRARSIARG